MNRRRLLAALMAAAGMLVTVPQAALAHGLVGREDLPIPKWLFGWAATVVLVVSFVGLAVLWPKPRLEQAGEKRWFSVPRLLDPLCGLIGVAIFVLLVYAGFTGSQESATNITPTFVFVIFWVGWNLVVPKDLRFDNYPFIFLTLMLSLQASYAAPLILLAQNRQEVRDRVINEQDRQANARAHADMEFLAREVASLRMALGEVATRDFLRSELRNLVEELGENEDEDSPDEGS